MIKNNIQTRSTKGFTLMEILIAMAILGIISSIGFASFTLAIKKARDSERKSDLQQVSKALEAYYSDFGVYPASQSDRIAGCGNGIPDDGIDGNQTCSWGASFSLDGGKVYMKNLPLEGRDGYFYVYVASTDQRQYQLFARLESEVDPGIDLSITTLCSEDGQECNYGIASSNATPTEVLE